MNTRDKRSAAEWVTFAVACAVVLTLVGLIVVEMGKGDDPPVLDARRAGAIREVDGKFSVAVEVRNGGQLTAANVQVTASLTIDGEAAESDQVVDFLAGGETETLVFLFADDPDDGQLEIDVASYAEP